MDIIKKQEAKKLLINQIIPMEIKERICIHCDKVSPEDDPMTYLIAGKAQGKSTETIRQAVFRRDAILSTEYDFYKSAGMKHITEANSGEVSFMGLRDIFDSSQDTLLKNKKNGTTVHICVDNARTILEELLTERFGVPVKIDFMALEA